MRNHGIGHHWEGLFPTRDLDDMGQPQLSSELSDLMELGGLERLDPEEEKDNLATLLLRKEQQ